MAQGEGGGPMTHGVATSHAPPRPQSFLRRNVFSVDHKVIGRQYLDLALVAVVTGMVLSWLMRFHLGWADTPVPGLGKIAPTGAAGGVITPEYYLALMTMHGTIMVFFVLTTAPFAGFGNFFLPLHVGAEDMAFPRINMTSFWVTLLAFLVLILAFFVGDGPPLSGWTAYAPLSAVGKDAGPGQGLGQTLWAVSIAIFCVAQLLGSLNFIATTLDLRTKGMSLARLPFATWAWFITSVIGLVAFAVLMPACILLILDRVAGTSFFIPAGLVMSDRLQPHAGGSARVHHLPDRDRVPELHGVGPSHVPERHEPALGDAIFGADAGDHHSRRDHHALVDRHDLRRAPAVHRGVALRAGLRLRVRERRPQRLLPRAALDRHLPARHLLRRGAFPFRDGRGRHVRHLRGHLLLVPEDVRSHDERDARQMALLADVHRRVLRVHADALPRTCRQRAPLFGVHRRLPPAAHPFASVHHDRGALHRRGPADLPVQSDPQPFPGTKGAGQSLGSHDARVVHLIAAAPR